MSRADKLTIEQKKIEYYSDFTNDFAKNPVTGFLARVTNEESVKQSIRNIIMTNRGERFYNPSFGSTVYASLFNPFDSTTLIAIKESITESINNFEPRAELKAVIVIPRPDELSVSVKIIFGIKNYIPADYTLDLVLTRLR
jgi:phage baseplate assembly protein W